VKPNYGAEKRRKELERKRKQEEKLQKKRDRKTQGDTVEGEEGQAPAEGEPNDEGSAEETPAGQGAE
jgi:hypothetical protein